jgi:acetyl esterase/lipase
MRFLILAVALLLGACGSQHFGRPDAPAPAPLQTPYSVVREQAYTPPDWPRTLRAAVYRPQGAGPFPSVLVIHGGAWKRGDYGYSEGLAGQLAARGYLAVSIEYRLVPEFVWPAQLHDVQQALRWMRSDAGRAHGIDPQRIATFGYSAGGHLSALVAGVAGDPQWGAPETQVRAVVTGGIPADLPRFKHGSLVPAFIGGSWEQKAEDFVAASPLTHVRAGHPPVFVYHAANDTLVPVEQAEVYRDALAAAGVTHEYFVLEGRGHITGALTDGPAIDAALEFLDRYLR